MRAVAAITVATVRALARLLWTLVRTYDKIRYGGKCLRV